MRDKRKGGLILLWITTLLWATMAKGVTVEDSLAVERFFAFAESIAIATEPDEYDLEAIVFNPQLKTYFVQVDSLLTNKLVNISQFERVILDKGREWSARCVGVNLLGPRSPSVLKIVVSDATDNIVLRGEAVKYFVGIEDDQEARDILFETSKEEYLWFPATMRLAQAHDNRVLSSTLRTLQSEENMIKLRSVMILGELKDTNTYLPLMNLYESLDAIPSDVQSPSDLLPMDIKARIITVLGKLGDNRALDFLLGKATSDSYYLSMNSIEALGDLANENAVPTLLSIVTQTDEISIYKRLECVRALSKIGVNTEEVLSGIEKGIALTHEQIVEKGYPVAIEDEMQEIYNYLKSK